MQSEQIDLLAAALVKAQAAMKPASMNKVNPHFKSRYADLSSVIESIRKPLTDNGLAFTQTVHFEVENTLYLWTTLLHTSGQWLRAEYPLPTNATPQQLGSALTYARRYSLSAITGTAADDDLDGEGTSDLVQAKQSFNEKRIPMVGKPNEDNWNMFCRSLCIGIRESKDDAEVEAWKEANRDQLDRLADKKFPYPEVASKLEATLLDLKIKREQKRAP